MSSSQTDNLTFLRGTVMSDEDGLAVINTIVPGWYSGRAVHVHTMVRAALPPGNLHTPCTLVHSVLDRCSKTACKLLQYTAARIVSWNAV